MHILKSSIALVLLLSACSTYEGGASTGPAEGHTPIFSSVVIGGEGGARPSIAPPPAQTAQEVAFMKAQLNAIQARSISENREYCGYLGIDPRGEYAISRPVRGRAASCGPERPPAGFRVIAFWHTHAAYSPRYDNEVPSVQDVEGDFQEGINGYLATPGGRIWFVNYGARRAELICGRNCVTSDPGFRVDRANPVPPRFTLASLRTRQQ